jgi:hypothetical protein
LKLTKRSDADPIDIKRRNIIDMALGFTAMMRIFSEGSKTNIEKRLRELFSGLPGIGNSEDYEACHRAFCEWFTREVRTAEKRSESGKAQESEPASYGHAAKVLDIAIKVYVYYCAQPDAEVAGDWCPFYTVQSTRPSCSTLSRYPPPRFVRELSRKSMKKRTGGSSRLYALKAKTKGSILCSTMTSCGGGLAARTVIQTEGQAPGRMSTHVGTRSRPKFVVGACVAPLGLACA